MASRAGPSEPALTVARREEKMSKGKIALTTGFTLAALLSFGSPAPAQLPGLGDKVKTSDIGKKKARLPAGGPDLSVRDAKIAGLDGNRLRLDVFLGQRGSGHHQDEVAVFWVEGGRRTKLWDGRTRFAGTRLGYKHQVTVDLPARRGNGHIEVVAGDRRKDPRWDNNVKRVELGGADLGFHGRPEIEQVIGGNPNRVLRLTVRNNGPGAAPRGCRVDLEIAEQGRPKRVRFDLPALRPGQTHVVQQRYHYRSSRGRGHNSAKAQIVCRGDLVGGNNTKQVRLR